jgi:hypothetical protein
MSNYSEDDVRNAAEIREWLIKQISDKQDEVEKLRTTLTLIDDLLKQGSFRAASSLGSSYALSSITHTHDISRKISAPINQKRATTIASENPESFALERKETEGIESKEIRSLKRIKDNMLLANAEIFRNTVEVSPAKGVNLNVNTPPFKSFFLNRILEGMKIKDIEKVSHGQIKESESLNYQIEEDNNGLINRIVIKNYRENERLTEIFNTCTWVFTRMIEKTGR